MRSVVYHMVCLIAVAVIFVSGERAHGASLSGSLQEADQLLGAGDVSAALEAYRNIQVDFPEAEEAQFGIGCAQYIQGTGQLTAEESAASFAAAEEVFSRLSIARNEIIREHAAYNRANTVAQTAKMIPAEQQYKEAVAAFHGAVSAYEGVLREYPEHRGAGQNLDHVRFLLKELLQNPPEPEDEDKPEQVSSFGVAHTDIEDMTPTTNGDGTVLDLEPLNPKGNEQ